MQHLVDERDAEVQRVAERRAPGSSSEETTIEVATPAPMPSTAATRGATTQHAPSSLGDPERGEGHPGEQLAHPLVGQQAAVRGGVDQAERRVRHRPGAVRAQPVVQLAEPAGPEVDVLPLQACAPARARRRAATPSRGPGRRSAAGAAARSRRASRPGRRGRPAASGAAADRSRPTARSCSLIETSISASTASLDGEVLVERRPGDPAGRAEVGDRDPVEAARREQLGRGREDLRRARSHGGAPRLAVANPALPRPPPRPGRGRRPCRALDRGDQLLERGRGSAPAWPKTRIPSRNAIRVGIDGDLRPPAPASARPRCRRCRRRVLVPLGRRLVDRRELPARPHQDAQKSTRTMSLSVTVCSKVSAVSGTALMLVDLHSRGMFLPSGALHRAYRWPRRLMIANLAGWQRR